MGSQDEIRRLMKEARQKPSGGAASSSAKTSNAKPKLPAKPSNSSSTAASKPQPAIPAGFYDDSLADAKARNVDVQQLADKQLESDWEAFQEFVARVEQQSAEEEQQQVEDAKEREAVEQLDHMQYVDRYRVALERATSLRNGEKKKKNPNKAEKRKLQEEAADDSVGNDQDAAEGASAVETAVSEYKKKHKRAKRQQHSDSEDSDDFDPCNWRSRAF